MSIDEKTLEMLANAIERKTFENTDNTDETKGKRDGESTNYDCKDR